VFGFGHGPELIIVLVIALIVLGPGKIPEVAQMLGKGLRELRKASSELQQTFDVQELMNPAATPPAPVPAPEPPPVEHNSILSPAIAEAVVPQPEARQAGPAEGLPGEPETAPKPRRTRRREALATTENVEGATISSGLDGSETPAASPRPRRRPPKKAAEPVPADTSV